MIDYGHRYTESQKRALERQGYEFKDATELADAEPMYIVCGYRHPEVPRGLSEHNTAGWEKP